MKNKIIISLFVLFSVSCVSAEKVEMNATVKTEKAAVQIVSVKRQNEYHFGNTRYFPKDSVADDLVLIEAGYKNITAEPVTVLPYAASLQPLENKRGILPLIVGFSNPGEAFLLGISGTTGESDVKLKAGQASRRVFVFVYPKNKEPDALILTMKSTGEKKYETWVTAPLKK
jgi:hypothetical protein